MAYAVPGFADHVRMNISAHGGGCCGMSHLVGFPARDIVPADRRVEYLKGQVKNALIRLGYTTATGQRTFRHCIEATVTSYQDKIWGEALAEVGFVPSMKFHNGNSGNKVIVYLLETNKPKPRTKKEKVVEAVQSVPT